MRVRCLLKNTANQYYKQETGASEFEENFTFNVNLRAKQHSAICMARCLSAQCVGMAHLYFGDLVEF
jgi:hypothetical protein